MYKGRGVLIHEAVLQCPRRSPLQKLWRIAERFYFLVTPIKERISDTLFSSPLPHPKGEGDPCYEGKVQALKRFPLS